MKEGGRRCWDLLLVWVDGKTGGCWLIARHPAIEVLERLHASQRDIQHLSFDDLLTPRCRHRVFRFGSGYQPKSFIGAFRRFLPDACLFADLDGCRRSLYSPRHTYATLALILGDIDILTLSRQMGTSVAKLERHYSKLTATIAAKRLG